MADEMTADEAFKLLNISRGSTQSEATKAFHELSKKFHPDAPGGSVHRQAQLNRAYEIAVESLRSRELVPVEVKNTLQAMEHGMLRYEAALERASIVASARRRRVSSLQQIKYILFLLAAMIVVFAWIVTQSGEGLLGRDHPLIKISAAAFAAMGAVVHFISQFLTQRFDYFNDRLNDEQFCLNILRRYDVPTDRQFDVEDLALKKREQEKSDIPVRPPELRELIEFFGFREREELRLALLKSVEHGILEYPGKSRRTYCVTPNFRIVLRP